MEAIRRAAVDAGTQDLLPGDPGQIVRQSSMLKRFHPAKARQDTADPSLLARRYLPAQTERQQDLFSLELRVGRHHDQGFVSDQIPHAGRLRFIHQQLPKAARVEVEAHWDLRPRVRSARSSANL